MFFKRLKLDSLLKFLFFSDKSHSTCRQCSVHLCFNMLYAYTYMYNQIIAVDTAKIHLKNHTQVFFFKLDEFDMFDKYLKLS